MPRNLLLLIALLGCPNAAPADSAVAERPHAEGCASGAWYADADGDGHGAGDATWACLAPAGTVGPNDDCDDTDSMVYPGAPHECRYGRDLDCDGIARNECDAAGDADRLLLTSPFIPTDVRGDVDSDGRNDAIMLCWACDEDEFANLGVVSVVGGAEIYGATREVRVATYLLENDSRPYGYDGVWIPDMDGDAGDEMLLTGYQGSDAWAQIVGSRELLAGTNDFEPDWGVWTDDAVAWLQGAVAMRGSAPGFALTHNNRLGVYPAGSLPIGDGVRGWSSEFGTARLLIPEEGNLLDLRDSVAAAAFPTEGLLLVTVFLQAGQPNQHCLFDPSALSDIAYGDVELAEACFADEAVTLPTAAGDLDGDGEADFLTHQSQVSVYSVGDILAGNITPRLSGDPRGGVWEALSASADLDGRGAADLVAATRDDDGELGYRMFAGESLPWGGTLSIEAADMTWESAYDSSAVPLLHTGGDFDGDGQGDLLLWNYADPSSEELGFSVVFGW